MRLSRATRLKPGDAARRGLLQSANELKLIGTSVVNRGQVVGVSPPTVPRNGWSARNSLENCWSLLVRMLNALPTSTKAARLTVSLMTGMRYSKLPSICVSPPTEVNDRGKRATLLPEVPVNVPSAAAVAGKPAIGTGVWSGFSATTTFREVMNESTGAIGLIERTL